MRMLNLCTTLISLLPLALGVPPNPSCSDCPASTTEIITTVVARRCDPIYTKVDSTSPGASCSFNDHTCIVPECLALSTTTAPCPTITDHCCKDLPKITSTWYKPCPTACPSPCGGTSWVVESAADCPTPLPAR
ncbi:hypothetical protein P152DRAFT_245907 [Eremomyces bilateralis CBS 781.70]|uniref:Uncharacterized protein n=1 Tax=Eremomyces bilateralis CBS 781.70 TaxID=1392243 RepID=A0A6G1GAP6_9PEZI|nr:uncharacterized protein P152DRAFT_245907 [Eremomyces bilateralis CBS 781.70]KAF1815103.1 hypothetical protein P152DRAFT_245907 [Eremomyces bilateralis CBS 781.70]